MTLWVDDPARCHAENNPRSRTPSAGDSMGISLRFSCKSGGHLISEGGGAPLTLLGLEGYTDRPHMTHGIFSQVVATQISLDFLLLHCNEF